MSVRYFPFFFCFQTNTFAQSNVAGVDKALVIHLYTEPGSSGGNNAYVGAVLSNENRGDVFDKKPECACKSRTNCIRG